jgi:general secretion pathway protein N
LIQSKRGLLLVAGLTFVIAVAAMFPARIAYRWAAPPDFAASGITGTVWQGGAAAVSVRGILLHDVSWRIKPLRFFTAKAAYQVKATPVSGFAEGIVALGFGGTVTVSDLVASLSLPMLAEVLNIRGLNGDASLEFERIRLRDGLPTAADGSVQVNNLVAPLLSRESIGGYRAEFSTADNGISASVEDIDGVVDLAGSFQLNDDRSYEFLGQVVAKTETPAALLRQMQYLGSANERGQRELRLEGSL